MCQTTLMWRKGQIAFHSYITRRRVTYKDHYCSFYIIFTFYTYFFKIRNTTAWVNFHNTPHIHLVSSNFRCIINNQTMPLSGCYEAKSQPYVLPPGMWFSWISPHWLSQLVHVNIWISAAQYRHIHSGFRFLLPKLQ